MEKGWSMFAIFGVIILLSLCVVTAVTASGSASDVKLLEDYAKSSGAKDRMLYGHQSYVSITGSSVVNYIDSWGTILIKNYKTEGTLVYFDLNSDGVIDAFASMDTSTDELNRLTTAYNLINGHFFIANYKMNSDSFVSIMHNDPPYSFIKYIKYMYVFESGLTRYVNFAGNSYEDKSTAIIRSAYNVEYLNFAKTLVDSLNLRPATTAQRLSSKDLLSYQGDFKDYPFSSDKVTKIGGNYQATLSDGTVIWWSTFNDVVLVKNKEADALGAAGVKKYFNAYISSQSNALGQAAPSISGKTQAVSQKAANIDILLNYAKNHENKDMTGRIALGHYANIDGESVVWYVDPSGTGTDAIAIIRFRSNFGEIFFDWGADNKLDAYVRFPIQRSFNPARLKEFLFQYKDRYDATTYTDDVFSSQVKSPPINTIKDEFAVFASNSDPTTPLKIFDFKAGNIVQGTASTSALDTYYSQELSTDAQNSVNAAKSLLRKGLTPQGERLLNIARGH